MSDRIPIILDTDIGGDIDDTWALIMMLRCPELDVRLITTSHRNVELRARLVARLLELAGRTDIPIGIGRREPDAADQPINQGAWVDDYPLSRYPGVVHDNGAEAIVRTIRESAEPITLVAIGSLPTVADALREDPGITANSRFVGMHGSIYRGYEGAETPCPESNVKDHVPDCQYVFASDWDMTITPLDTCGLVRLTGEPYQSIRRSEDPLLQALMVNNELFARNVQWKKGYNPTQCSSTLFDTVAVYLAFSEGLVRIERLPIIVTDDGYTRVDDAGKPVNCAVEWRDLPAFNALLVERLLAADH